MKIKIENKIQIETNAYYHNNKLKTYPCELGEWWGNETCDEINFNSEINKINLPEGQYKIIISLEKINE
jgi:hypothetical protein